MKLEYKLVLAIGGAGDDLRKVIASYATPAAAEASFRRHHGTRPDLDYELWWRGHRWIGRYVTREDAIRYAANVPGATPTTYY